MGKPTETPRTHLSKDSTTPVMMFKTTQRGSVWQFMNPSRMPHRFRTIMDTDRTAAEPHNSLTKCMESLKLIQSSGKITKAPKKQPPQKHPMNRAVFQIKPDNPSQTPTASCSIQSDQQFQIHELPIWRPKELKEQTMSKKVKLGLKKALFQSKIEHIKQLEKEKQMERERQKTVITGDMRPLFDALPSVEQRPFAPGDDNVFVKRAPKHWTQATAETRQDLVINALTYFANGMSDDHTTF